MCLSWRRSLAEKDRSPIGNCHTQNNLAAKKQINEMCSSARRSRLPALKRGVLNGTPRERVQVPRCARADLRRNPGDHLHSDGSVEVILLAAFKPLLHPRFHFFAFPNSLRSTPTTVGQH